MRKLSTDLQVLLRNLFTALHVLACAILLPAKARVSILFSPVAFGGSLGVSEASTSSAVTMVTSCTAASL